jgi:ornithine--oxo-acid transaminase
MPVSAVLCDNFIMDHIKPGHHGSTYGGNALACAVTMKSLEVLIKEGMAENSAKMGEYLMNFMKKTLVSKKIKDVRGRGLFIGLEFEEGDIAYQFSKLLLKNGLIAKPTQKNIIRFSPPLVISKNEMEEAFSIIQESWDKLKTFM